MSATPKSQPLDGFHCITIPRSEQQLKFSEAWEGLDVEFFPGVDHQSTSVSEVRTSLLEYHKKPPDPYPEKYLAMTLSHVKLWHKLLDGDGDRWVIFEDDSRPAFPIEEILREFEKVRPYLAVKFTRIKGHSYWVGTDCYSVTREGLQTLVEYPHAYSPDVLLEFAFHNQPRGLLYHKNLVTGNKPEIGHSQNLQAIHSWNRKRNKFKLMTEMPR